MTLNAFRKKAAQKADFSYLSVDIWTEVKSLQCSINSQMTGSLNARGKMGHHTFYLIYINLQIKGGLATIDISPSIIKAGTIIIDFFFFLQG